MQEILVGVAVALAGWFTVRRALRSFRRAANPNPCESACSGCSHCPGKTAGPLGVLLLLAAGPTRAVDTIETWNRGATDVEYYIGWDGLGRDLNGNELRGDLILGFGVTEELSVYVGVSIAGTNLLSSAEPSLSLGVFGTPLRTPHIDLDLLLGVSAEGPDMEAFSVAPGFELCWSASPERAGFGLYLRGFTRLGGQPGDSGASAGFLAEMRATAGAFFSVASGHQLLAEVDGLFRPSNEKASAEVGGLALGYNARLDDTLELISQVFLDLPQAGEPFSAGVLVGFIATLPAAR